VASWLVPLLCVLFFCSGACALVYQVMWLRLLALVFGVTVYAASTVLASFMGGLAIGSYSAGRIAGSLRSPLRAFGFLEIGIGLSALATPLVLEAVKQAWIAWQPSLPSSLFVLTLARFVAAFAVLIVPTTLMGATLPIVMRSALVADAVTSTRIGLLYAINTGGAIVGALVAGFYLISTLGVARSFEIAATVNALIGLVAIFASTRLPAGAPRADVPPPATGAAPKASGSEPLSTWQARSVLWTFLLSGIMSLALEIVWFRTIVTLLRPTAYAFTIMLAAVLAGIAAGSAIATPLLARRGRWLPVLTIVQLAIGIASVLSLNALEHSQNVWDRLVPTLTGLGVDPYIAPIAISSLLAMLPTTVLLGFAFPIGLALWAGRGRDAERRIGVFYSLNVCGAIAGSILGGFVLLPLAGSRGSLIASAALALVSCVLLALSQWKERPNFAGFMAIVGPVAFAMSALNAADPSAIGAAAHRNDRVIWREEGVQTTVAVHEQGSAQPGRARRVMYLDGMHQASDYPQMTFVHHRIGAMPVMLHPDPKQALVVGLGGGATAGAVAQYPGVHVDVVELSQAVVGGAGFFRHVNFDLLQRPNVTLRVDDGRNYLLTTRKKYDVITADLMLPHHAGAGALYSREYFELVRNALDEDGIVLQWNGGDSDFTYRLLLRTFLSVFPHASLWADGTLMVGSLRPFEFSRGAYERRFADPQFRKLFDWNYDTLAKTYLGGGDAVRAWVGEGPVLSDDKPIIEYFLSVPKDGGQADLRTLKGHPAEIIRP
jgi:spermidine synthase